MYGIEVAVILVACLFSLAALWSAPMWMRALNTIIAKLSRQVDRVDAENDKDMVIPKEER